MINQRIKPPVYRGIAIKIHGFVIIDNISGNELISLENIISVASLILNKDPKVIENNALNSSIRGSSNKYALKNLNWFPEIDLKQGLNLLNNYLNENSYDY